MKSKILKNNTWYGLVAVLVFAPIAHGAVDLIPLTIVELAVCVLVFVWLWRLTSRGKRREEEDAVEFLGTRADLPLWLFVCLSVISCIFSIYRYASLSELLRLLAGVGVFYLATNNLNRAAALRMSVVLVGLGAGLSLLGLGQYFFGLNRSWWVPPVFLASTYVNHNHFAGFLELTIPLGMGILLGLRKAEMSSAFKLLSFRFFLWAGLGIMFMAFLFAQSRGAWASLAGALTVMAILLVKKKILSQRVFAASLLIAVLVIVFVAGGYDAPARRMKSMEEIASKEFLQVRKKIWVGSIELIKAHPLTGTGIGTFVWAYPPYRPHDLRQRAHYAHNDYLQVISEMGLFGLILLMWMFNVVVGGGLRWYNGRIQKGKGRRQFGLEEGVAFGATIGLLSIALHGLTDFNLHIPANMLVVALLAGIVMRRITLSDSRRTI